MNDIKPEDIQETETSSVETQETDVEQNHLEKELERVKAPKSELEKAAFSLKKTADRIKELGADPEELLGIKAKAEENDDDVPLTRGEWKKMQAEEAQKSALDLTNDISDPTERELTRYHLENTIRSTGNPQEDLKLARTIVNGVKSQQIAELAASKIPAKSHSSATSAPAKVTTESTEQLTAEELAFTKPPFNMSREAVLKLRK